VFAAILGVIFLEKMRKNWRHFHETASKIGVTFAKITFTKDNQNWRYFCEQASNFCVTFSKKRQK
jgi:hypothetical protein